MQGQESIKHKSLETHLVTSGLWVFQTSYTLAQARRPDQGWTFLVLCCWSFSLFVTFFPFAFKASKINHSLGVCTHQHPMANRHHTLKYMVFFFCFVLFAFTFLNAKNMWYLQDWKNPGKINQSDENDYETFTNTWWQLDESYMMQEHTWSWTPVAATIQSESVECFGWLTTAVLYVHEHTDGLQHISVHRIIISIQTLICRTIFDALLNYLSLVVYFPLIHVHAHPFVAAIKKI